MERETKRPCVVSDDDGRPSSPEKKPEMRLAIVGWRGFTNKTLFDTELKNFTDEYGMPSLVVSGGAKGADTLAEEWAKEHNIKMLTLKPDWSTGKAAGILRNTDIVRECTHMVAFPSEAYGKGTQDSIRKAKRDGKPVRVCQV
jgi:hypothetical protein